MMRSLLLGVGIGLFGALAVLIARYVAGGLKARLKIKHASARQPSSLAYRAQGVAGPALTGDLLAQRKQRQRSAPI
jgi:hypothetical protein